MRVAEEKTNSEDPLFRFSKGEDFAVFFLFFVPEPSPTCLFVKVGTNQTLPGYIRPLPIISLSNGQDILRLVSTLRNMAVDAEET